MKVKNFVMMFLLVVFFPILFCACASTDIEHNDTAARITASSCEYRAVEDKTLIIFDVAIHNATIYNMKEETFVISLYKNGAYVRDDTVTYNFKIKADSTDTKHNCTFLVDGDIDAIGDVFYFSCKYCSFWETYQLYFYIGIGVIVVGVVIAILAKIFDW